MCKICPAFADFMISYVRDTGAGTSASPFCVAHSNEICRQLLPLTNASIKSFQRERVFGARA